MSANKFSDCTAAEGKDYVERPYVNRRKYKKRFLADFEDAVRSLYLSRSDVCVCVCVCVCVYVVCLGVVNVCVCVGMYQGRWVTKSSPAGLLPSDTGGHTHTHTHTECSAVRYRPPICIINTR